MPTNTFLNLNPEKIERVDHAALHEFSCHPYDEVSINVIIKAAGISRGSFYQYFEDKKDLYEYVFYKFLNTEINTINNAIVTHNGDLFAAFRTIMETKLKLLKDEKKYHFYKNHLLHTKSIIINRLDQFRANDKTVMTLIDHEKYNINTIDDLSSVIMLLGSSLEKIITHAVIYEWDAEYTLKKYSNMTRIVEKGVLKNEG